MTDHGGDPARDQAGKLIGGETAHAPSIHQGDNLTGVVGPGATNADDVAAELACGGSSSNAEQVAPLTVTGASAGDARLRGTGAGGAEGGGEGTSGTEASGTPSPP